MDHSTLNRWLLAYAPIIERRLRAFRKPHCGSVRIDETYIKIRGQWRYLYRAIDKRGEPVDFLLTANRDLGLPNASSARCCRISRCSPPTGSAPRGRPVPGGDRGQPGRTGLLARAPYHYVTKHLQQGIESDHFRVKRPMPRVGAAVVPHGAAHDPGLRSDAVAAQGLRLCRRMDDREQNQLLQVCFGLPAVNEV